MKNLIKEELKKISEKFNKPREEETDCLSCGYYQNLCECKFE